MKHFTTILITLLFFSLSCSFSFAQKTKSGEDSEVVATYFTVVDLILTNQFAKLTQLLDEAADSGNMTADGKRRLEEIYTELLKMDPALLNRWADNSSQSAHPFIVRGKYNLNLAVNKLRQEGEHTFVQPTGEIKLLLRKAQADLETAYGLNPANPAAPAELVAVAMYRGYPAHIMNQWFDRANQADPAWLAQHRHKLYYLSPGQHGSQQEILDFAMECVRNAPPGTRTYSVLFEYYDMLRERGQAADLPQEARDIFLAAVAKFKGNFPYTYEPHYYEALFKAQHGAPQEAEYILTSILREEPENVRVLAARLSLYMEKEEWLKAKPDCANLITLAPNSPLATSCNTTIKSRLEDKGN